MWDDEGGTAFAAPSAPNYFLICNSDCLNTELLDVNMRWRRRVSACGRLPRTDASSLNDVLVMPTRTFRPFPVDSAGPIGEGY